MLVFAPQCEGAVHERRGFLPMTKGALGAALTILEDLPLWLFALLTVGAFNAIAFGGLVCTRRFGQWLGLYTVIDNDTVSEIFQAVLVMYAISLGLIAVASWGNSSAAAAAASEEASHIATVYRTLGGFPQPLQDDLKDSVVRYTQFIIEKAWPAQQRREVTEEGIEIILHLWRQITQFEPTTPGQLVVHRQVLDNFNKLVEFRRRRIEAASYAVPGALWAVVLIGAAVSIFGYVPIHDREFVGTRAPDHLACDDDRFIGVLHRHNRSSL